METEASAPFIQIGICQLPRTGPQLTWEVMQQATSLLIAADNNNRVADNQAGLVKLIIDKESGLGDDIPSTTSQTSDANFSDSHRTSKKST